MLIVLKGKLFFNTFSYISLVLEYMEGYSLADIMENFGSLNENLMQKIGSSLLSCLAEFEDLFVEDFGEICPCHILFDKYGNLKVKLLIIFSSALSI